MDPAKALVAIAGTLAYVTPLYGAREEPSDEMMDEAVDLIFHYYNYLGVNEIRQAYRLWKAGRFEAEAFFFGEFTISQLSSVLRGYVKFRREVSIQIISAENEVGKEETDRQKKSKYMTARQALRDGFPGYLEMVWAGCFPMPETPDDVSDNAFTYATENHLITWSSPDEKWPYWTLSKRMGSRAARADLANRKGESGTRFVDVVDFLEELMKAKSRIYARKLVVFERVFYGPRFFEQARARGLYPKREDVPEWFLGLCVRGRIFEIHFTTARQHWKNAQLTVYLTSGVDLSAANSHDPQARKLLRKQLYALRPQVKAVYAQMYVFAELFGQ